VFVHGVRHQRHGRYVVVAPQATFDVGREITAVVDLRFLGADDSPAALGLHPAHGGKPTRHAVAERVAVGHLVKAVGRGDRTDRDGFKQNVEGRGHHVAPSRRVAVVLGGQRGSREHR